MILLTGDLLHYHRRGGYLKPIFTDTNAEAQLQLAAQLLTLYSDGVEKHLRREELEERLDPLLKGRNDAKFVSALNKLILDGCEFGKTEEVDHQARRAELFDRSVKLLTSEQPSESYRQTVIAEFPWAGEDIYGDLPQNERLEKIRPLFPRELLQRYNLSQVQSLLLYADEMELIVGDSRIAELRRLFKYLKFFRLLADITTYKSPSPRWKHKNALKLTVSGPLSLFDNTRKYALQLAGFFPAVCALECWQLSCTIKLRNGSDKLVLDEKCDLVSHYHNFSSYVPEEIALFHRLFREKISDFQIIGETPFLSVGGQNVIFPDLSFQHIASQTIFHLELFHRWHYGQLQMRLQELKKLKKTLPLFIGVDRALMKEEKFNQLLEEHKEYQNKVFYFRDFPGVDRVHKLLLANIPS